MRNGMKMLQHVTFHSDQYQHPGWMIFMGVFLCIATFFCEVVNIINILNQSTIQGTALGFAAFEVFVTI